MEMYLYVNSNIVLDAIPRGAFLCTDNLNENTLGTIYSHGFFVTSKKLDCSLWTNCCSPVAVELSFPHYESDKETRLNRKQLKVLIVKSDYTTFRSTFDKYDPSEHLGVVISGIIPFSYVSKLYLMENDYPMFYPSSPDSWNPKQLEVKIFENTKSTDLYCGDCKYFIEKIDCIEKLKKVIAKIPECKEVVVETKKYEKELAIRFAMVLHSYFHDYEFFGTCEDIFLSSIFENEAIFLNSKFLFEKKNKIYDPLNESNENLDKCFFSCIKNFLLQSFITQETSFDRKLFDLLIVKIKSECTCEKLFDLDDDFDLLYRLLFKYEDLISNIKFLLKKPVLYALFLIFKNPHDENSFVNSMEVEIYKVSQVVKRIAWIFFASINGMRVIPGEKKKNLRLLQKIEKDSMKSLDADIQKPIFVINDANTMIDEIFKDELAFTIKLTDNNVYKFFNLYADSFHIDFKSYFDGVQKKDQDSLILRKYRKYRVIRNIQQSKGDLISYSDTLNYEETNIFDNELFSRHLSDVKQLKKLYKLNKDFFKNFYCEQLRGLYNGNKIE